MSIITIHQSPPEVNILIILTATRYTVDRIRLNLVEMSKDAGPANMVIVVHQLQR